MNPTLATDFFTWPFVLTLAAIVALAYLTRWLLRVDVTDMRLDGDDDPFAPQDRLQADVNRYHCASHGHYYGRHPAVEPTRRVWTCVTCGAQAFVSRNVYDQEVS